MMMMMMMKMIMMMMMMMMMMKMMMMMMILEQAVCPSRRKTPATCLLRRGDLLHTIASCSMEDLTKNNSATAVSSFT